MSKLKILEHEDIILKLDRIAWQIAEEFHREKEIIVLGIQERGSAIAELIHQKLVSICSGKISIAHLHIDKDKALESSVEIVPNLKLASKAVVIVDDVLNSGITMAAVFKRVLEEKPRYVKVAVLANRDHKSFPIHPDFVGISLATTVMEHISLVKEDNKMAVYLV